MAKPTGRAAIHSIDHFALAVPDVEAAARFYEAFGLDVTREGGALALRTRAGGHVWGRVLPAGGKHLAWLSFGCYRADFDALVAQCEAAGAAAAERPEAGDDEGRWFADPDGNRFQLKVGPKVTPAAKRVATQHSVEPRGVNGGMSRAARVHPERLSHCLLFSTDVPRQARFYEQALGLRVSDRSLDIIAFMHAPHGSDHHLVAFAKSDRRGWHHASWDVASIEEVGVGAMHMRRAGYERGWGTGRHVLGSNYFHYVQDPFGSFNEYSAGIDFVPAGSTWDGGDHDPEDSMYFWGPDVPDYFLANTDSGADA